MQQMTVAANGTMGYHQKSNLSGGVADCCLRWMEKAKHKEAVVDGRDYGQWTTSLDGHERTIYNEKHPACKDNGEGTKRCTKVGKNLLKNLPKQVADPPIHFHNAVCKPCADRRDIDTHNGNVGGGEGN